MSLAYVLGDTCSYLLGKILGEYHKKEILKWLYKYIYWIIRPSSGVTWNQVSIYISSFNLYSYASELSVLLRMVLLSEIYQVIFNFRFLLIYGMLPSNPLRNVPSRTPTNCNLIFSMYYDSVYFLKSRVIKVLFCTLGLAVRNVSRFKTCLWECV